MKQVDRSKPRPHTRKRSSNNSCGFCQERFRHASERKSHTRKCKK